MYSTIIYYNSSVEACLYSRLIKLTRVGLRQCGTEAHFGRYVTFRILLVFPKPPLW